MGAIFYYRRGQHKIEVHGRHKEYTMSSGMLMTNITEVFHSPPHREVKIPKEPSGSLEGVGFKRSIGRPAGQIADYRKATSRGKSIHVREYGSFYKIHWDHVDPSIDAIEHLRRDAPEEYVLLTTSIGGSIGMGIGFLVGGKKRATVGCILGLIAGLVFGCITADWSG